MMILRLLALLVGLYATDATAAMCDVRSATPTFADLTALGLLICDTSGNVKMSLGTLLSCEDQTNNLCMVSGGAVRQTTVTMGAAATANGTTAVFALPTGSKSIYGQVSGTGAVTQTQAIYGDIDNDA